MVQAPVPVPVMMLGTQVMGDFQVKAGAQLTVAGEEVAAAKARFAELAAYVNGASNAGVADPQVAPRFNPTVFTNAPGILMMGHLRLLKRVRRRACKGVEDNPCSPKL